MFNNWRDCQEFRKSGVTLSTTSNEACKLYDASLTQFVGWYEDESMGGMKNCLGKMMEADPNFVVGYALKNGLMLLSSCLSVGKDAHLKSSIDTMVTLANSSNISTNEKKHARAIELWSQGDLVGACQVWEDILVDNPLDMLALKLVWHVHFMLGHFPAMRDTQARCLSYWKPDMPLYGYLLGMYAFGLEETNIYDKAEKLAKQALHINPRDCWSTHTMCHVMEMQGRHNEGISFMGDTENEWKDGVMIAGHNYWHWGLFYIERGDYEKALDIYDDVLGPACVNGGSMLDITNACAILYRLEMEGVNVKDRWREVFETVQPHTQDHISTFSDVHIITACLRANEKETANKMMESLKEFVRNGCPGHNRTVAREVGLGLCEAFVAYDDEDFAKAVDLLFPLRYKIVTMGGSHAQRDFFNLFLIHAALKSNAKNHHKLARQLLMERKAQKDESPMTDRLLVQVLALHTD